MCIAAIRSLTRCLRAAALQRFSCKPLTPSLRLPSANGARVGMQYSTHYPYP
ncbi:hypothetical protein AZ54_13105 [Xanthomonas oryzae pv. oryzae PXO86]|uniref:Uncharacterized protein n=1 Tax=Xanthomonas oryzae pv. oryzae (strain PXO99A) TaxID=360094 RepID=A0A0K0GKF4_XANOP|nr:hypothetical protein PXO_00710 [Xanthomonas oryzae pv. oryzae PXO99A]AJQ83425.1 hypothetical protein AZ54_13105 [Xanthomonas oryzae pv. oryzae PXO86]